MVRARTLSRPMDRSKAATMISATETPNAIVRSGRPGQLMTRS